MQIADIVCCKILTNGTREAQKSYDPKSGQFMSREVHDKD